MSTHFRGLFLANFVALAAALVGLIQNAGVAADWRPVGESEATAKVYQALGQPTTLEFIETPLQDVVDYLRELHDIEIQVDTRVLEETGIGTDSPVTRNLKGVSLASALRLMLRDFNFTYEVRDEVLLITSHEESEKRTTTEVYDVEPLINAEHKIDELAEAITKALGRHRKMPPADAKEVVKGQEPKEEPKEEPKAARGIAVYRNFLFVTDSDSGQREVQRLLGLIGAGLQTRPERGIR